MKVIFSTKVIVKRMINFIGFDLQRIKKRGEARRITMGEVLSHIASLGFKPKTVIDVGVATGTEELYTTFPKARHILIEPLKEFTPFLKKISQKYNAEYVIAAAGPKSGTTEINVHRDLLGSSIYHEADGATVDGISRKVPTITIDSLYKKLKLHSPFLLKVDVQGGELSVLRGATKVLQDSEVVLLEVHFFEFFIHGPQFYDVVHYMKRQGFVAYDIFGGYNRPIDYALASVDMIFVKKHGRFRKTNQFAYNYQRGELNKEVLNNAMKTE